MGNDGRGASSHCVLGTTCLHLGGIALNCAIPSDLLGGMNVTHLEIFMRNRGLLALAPVGIGFTSPRALNGVACPVGGGVSINVGLALWYSEIEGIYVVGTWVS